MQAGCGRIESPVEGDRARGECRAQFVEVGVVREQATPGELVEDVGHGDIVPSLLACAETGFCLARRGAYGRYTDTVGSPVIQNRHGRLGRGADPDPGPAADRRTGQLRRARPGRHRAVIGPGPAGLCPGQPGLRRVWPPYPQRRPRVADVGAVLLARDAQRLAEPGGAAGQVASLRAGSGSGAPWPGPVTLDHPARPQQHRGRGAFRQAHQVHAEVHAVGEVHVRVPGRAEHHRVACGLATVGMGGRVGLPRDRPPPRSAPRRPGLRGSRARSRSPAGRAPPRPHCRRRSPAAAARAASLMIGTGSHSSHRLDPAAPPIGHEAVWASQRNTHTQRPTVDPVPVPV